MTEHARRLMEDMEANPVEEHRDDDLGWVKDAERWICQLQGVRQCKIDIDDAGEVSGVHVVTTTERDPRLVVRDVEGLLKARLDLDVYYKKIGIVQVLDGDPVEEAATPAPETSAPRLATPAPHARTSAEPVPPPRVVPAPTVPHPAVLVEESTVPRVECASVGVTATGSALTASVELRHGEARIRTEESGPNHPGIDRQLIARAAIRALDELLDEGATLSLADLRETEMAGERVTLAAVDLVEGRRSERFFGSCSQRYGAHQASVYAVLDALNRRLELMTFKEVRGASLF